MRKITMRMLTLLGAGAMAFQLGGCSITDMFGGVLGG
jgi:hypothetical protein